MGTMSRVFWPLRSHGQAWLEQFGVLTSDIWIHISMYTLDTMYVLAWLALFVSVNVADLNSSQVMALDATTKATTGFVAV